MLSNGCPRCGPGPRQALGAARYRCVSQIVIGMVPAPEAGQGLDRIPLFSTTISGYPDVVVEGYLGHRVWTPESFVTIGQSVSIEGSQWRVVANADDPVGPPQPIYGDCGEVYVDEHEALLLLS